MIKKYIRTKDGVYEVEKKLSYCYLDKNDNEYLFEDILSQADTIEELCDEFVVKYNSFNPIIHDTLEETEYLDKMVKIKGYTIYAAIWIEIKLPDGTNVFRLEPQAIMNDKGKLVLTSE